MPLTGRAAFLFRGNVSSPDIGQKRPYKIGAPAHVETAQSMYPYITPYHTIRKPRGRSWALLTVSATCDPSVSCWSPRMFLASSAGGLWRAAEAAEIADAMIEAHRDILR